MAGVNHAVSTLGVLACLAIVGPLGGFHQLLEAVGVTFLKQVARLLPAKEVVGGNAPGCALVVALAHEKLKEQWRLVEVPLALAVGQNRFKEFFGFFTMQEAVLVRS